MSVYAEVFSEIFLIFLAVTLTILIFDNMGENEAKKARARAYAAEYPSESNLSGGYQQGGNDNYDFNNLNSDINNLNDQVTAGKNAYQSAQKLSKNFFGSGTGNSGSSLLGEAEEGAEGLSELAPELALAL